MKWNQLRGVVVSSGYFGMALALLWHFSNIVRNGSHWIQEPVKEILYCEIAAIVTLMILGAVELFCLFKCRRVK